MMFLVLTVSLSAICVIAAIAGGIACTRQSNWQTAMVVWALSFVILTLITVAAAYQPFFNVDAREAFTRHVCSIAWLHGAVGWLVGVLWASMTRRHIPTQ